MAVAEITSISIIIADQANWLTATKVPAGWVEPAKTSLRHFPGSGKLLMSVM
ncbi:hypothetical protein [Bradyrhizobium sp. STM 3843]|uniref:hypothetical protein n=1 Tax=Bradyrhizobium sp. STM 3843 TaxID=551947 RepID=UPI0002D8E61F|nr:hypothetical protein [Bradyrhizobium sp. STM 3843]